MTSGLNLLKGGALCLSFFLMSCSNEQTIVERCDNFEKTDAQQFKTVKVAANSALVLETTEELGEINSNIPPKIEGDKLFLITNNNVVLRYDLSQKGRLKGKVAAKLPNVYESLSDYIVENDSIISFCSNFGNYSIAEFNTHSKKLRLIKTDTTMCHSMPFLGLSLRKIQDKFLFPMVTVNDVNEKGNFLSVYNQQKRYGEGIGDFSLFDQNKFAPYFETPVMSEITNGIFYLTATSSNGVVKCSLKPENKKMVLEPLSALCFSKQTFDRFTGTMTKSDLGDFAKMEESYITKSYVVGLYLCGNNLIRVSKREQSFMNETTSTKNVLMNAPWTMEILNLKNQSGEICEIEKERFRFTNAFVHKNHFFVLSNQSNQHEIIYHSLR